MIVTTNRLIVQMLIAAVVLAGANVLIAHMARHSVPRQLIDKIDKHPHATLLAAGNSLVEAAFDEDCFRETWDQAPSPSPQIQPLNIALGASGTVEQLLLLRHAFSDNHSARIVVYGFFNDQLTETPVGGWDQLTGNRAMSYYVEPYFAANIYAPQSRLNLYQTAIVSHVPMLVERLTLWSKVEKIRRKIEEFGLPHQRTTVFGRAGDFAAMEIKDDEKFKRTCQACVDQKLPFNPAVEQMLELTRKNGATFILVEMPMRTAHRDRHYTTPTWKNYHTYLQSLAVQKGALFINASDWLPDTQFADDLHADDDGKITFSTRLAKELKNRVGSDLQSH